MSKTMKETKRTKRIETARIAEELDEAQDKAKARLLGERDIDWFVRNARRARAFARRHGIPAENVCVEVNGGGVPNSYRYPAETSMVALVGGRLIVGRARARSGAHGRTLERVVRVYIGSVADRPELRRARSVERFHGGYAYLREVSS